MPAKNQPLGHLEANDASAESHVQHDEQSSRNQHSTAVLFHDSRLGITEDRHSSHSYGDVIELRRVNLLRSWFSARVQRFSGSVDGESAVQVNQGPMFG